MVNISFVVPVLISSVVFIPLSEYLYRAELPVLTIFVIHAIKKRATLFFFFLFEFDGKVFSLFLSLFLHHKLADPFFQLRLFFGSKK